MVERVKLRISYRRLYAYLTDELDYTESRAKQTISALRKVDPSILKAFLTWFRTKDLPEEPLFGVNIEALCRWRGLDPVAACLTVDWAAREPKQAYNALSHVYDSLELDEEDEAEIEEIIKENGWEIPGDILDTGEDESDLAIEEGGE